MPVKVCIEWENKKGFDILRDYVSQYDITKNDVDMTDEILKGICRSIDETETEEDREVREEELQEAEHGEDIIMIDDL